MVRTLPANTGELRDVGSVPGSGRSPWRRRWQPTPVFLPGKSHGQRSLAGYSSWSCKESDATEQLTHTLRKTPHPNHWLILTRGLPAAPPQHLPFMIWMFLKNKANFFVVFLVECPSVWVASIDWGHPFWQDHHGRGALSWVCYIRMPLVFICPITVHVDFNANIRVVSTMLLHCKVTLKSLQGISCEEVLLRLCRYPGPSQTYGKDFPLSSFYLLLHLFI